MPPQDQQFRQDPPRHEPGGVGPIIGAVIVVILLIFGALYFWGQQLNREKAPDTPLIQGGLSVTP
jgi:hypothetical protein